MRRSAIAVVAILLVITTYICIYFFHQSINALNRYRECAERFEVLQALTHLTISAIYLLFAIIMLLLIGIFMYLIIALLQTELSS
jgi:hypothetical protein